MPRPREFDIDEALEAAMQVFWQRGYRNTSMRDLLAAMQIGQSSFYETFGNKRELYLRSLDRFHAFAQSGPVMALEVESDIPGAVRSFFEGMVEAMTGDNPVGCFFGNASVENSGADADVSRFCRAGFDFIRGRFEQALGHARELGEIRRDQDPAALASFFVSTFYGLQVLAKSGIDRSVLEDTIEVALNRIGA